MPSWKKSYLSSFWLILGKNIEIFSTAIKTTACNHPIENNLKFRFWRRSMSHDKKMDLNLTSHDRGTILDQWTKKRARIDTISRKNFFNLFCRCTGNDEMSHCFWGGLSSCLIWRKLIKMFTCMWALGLRMQKDSGCKKSNHGIMRTTRGPPRPDF